MKTWDQFLPDVLIVAPATSMPAARRALMNAAQDFCRETRAWQVQLDATSTSGTELDYAIELPSKTELVRIESATLDGSDFAVWRGGERERSSTRYVDTTDALNVRFSEQPAAGQSLVLTCALMPAEGAAGVDDSIYRQYRRDIAAGAIAAITGDPGRQAVFESRCAEVRYQLWRGRSAARPRARPSFF
jgi:hypothetical protein